MIKLTTTGGIPVWITARYVHYVAGGDLYDDWQTDTIVRVANRTLTVKESAETVIALLEKRHD